MKTPKNLIEKIEKAILREEVSHRGGGVEIDLSQFGFKEGSKMAAYQNYLGGGMLSRIMTNHNIRTSLTEKQNEKLEMLASELAKYFHSLTNRSDDEWESATFEQNQNRPASAY